MGQVIIFFTNFGAFKTCTENLKEEVLYVKEWWRNYSLDMLFDIVAYIIPHKK